jgi:sodium/hydrogen antiporter
MDLRADAGRCVRLLAVGLPLTVLAGWAIAAWLLPGLGVWLALLVGASLAPTDAALGVPVVSEPAVPARIRRLITVESGLNDGIVTPWSSSRWPAQRPRRGSPRHRARSRRS